MIESIKMSEETFPLKVRTYKYTYTCTHQKKFRKKIDSNDKVISKKKKKIIIKLKIQKIKCNLVLFLYFFIKKTKWEINDERNKNLKNKIYYTYVCVV